MVLYRSHEGRQAIQGKVDQLKLDKSQYYDLLTGRMEPRATGAGVPDFAYSPMNRSGELYSPIIDEYHASNAPKPHWPDGKSFAVCLTHDVDAVAELDPVQNMASMLHLFRTRQGRKGSELMKWMIIHKLRACRGMFGREPSLCRFEDWQSIEDKYGARSTFFFAPGDVLQKHPSDCQYSFGQKIPFGDSLRTVAELMRALSSSGWEIGLHPSWHAHADLTELKHQKLQVESVLGEEIQSVRQHFLKYDPRLTPLIHEQAGFKYDSTLGFNDNIGFRRGTSYPYPLIDLEADKRLDLLEIPLTLQDGALLLPDKGLRLDVSEALKYIELMIEQVINVGGVLNLSWHPHTRHFPGFWELYEKTLDLVSQADPYFGTVSEIGTHWKNNVDIDLLKITSGVKTSTSSKGS